mmetsp:Transcript_22608/g.35912  ORF Transcript_22608/g.35912 Transcript_22608/m.35912 type:complete len:228 (-) Transcript_22608:840-1523(-)
MCPKRGFPYGSAPTVTNTDNAMEISEHVPVIIIISVSIYTIAASFLSPSPSGSPPRFRFLLSCPCATPSPISSHAMLLDVACSTARMLCCVCDVVLCCAVLCCAVQCCVVLCCVVLCCVVLCMSCCVVLCFEQEHQHQMVHLTPGGNTDVARVGCREVVSNAICKWNRRACNQRSGYEQKDLCYYIHHRNTGKCLPGAHGVGPLYCLHNWNTSIAQSHENHAHNNSI